MKDSRYRSSALLPVVADGGEGSWRSSSGDGGRVKGPDCISSSLTRVLLVKVEDNSIISCFFVVLCILYPQRRTICS